MLSSYLKELNICR